MSPIHNRLKAAEKSLGAKSSSKRGSSILNNSGPWHRHGYSVTPGKLAVSKSAKRAVNMSSGAVGLNGLQGSSFKPTDFNVAVVQSRPKTDLLDDNDTPARSRTPAPKVFSTQF